MCHCMFLGNDQCMLFQTAQSCSQQCLHWLLRMWHLKAGCSFAEGCDLASIQKLHDSGCRSWQILQRHGFWPECMPSDDSADFRKDTKEKKSLRFSEIIKGASRDGSPELVLTLQKGNESMSLTERPSSALFLAPLPRGRGASM